MRGADIGRATRMRRASAAGASWRSARPLLGLGSPTCCGCGSPRPSSDRASRTSNKSLIVFWTHGGMSQQDTYDLKPDAPAEFRGHVPADRDDRAGHPDHASGFRARPG